MYKTVASPHRIWPKDHININYYLLSLARNNRLKEAGPLFVYESLEEYVDLVDFIVIHGHHRLELAKQVNVPELELLVVENGADFGALPGYQAYSDDDFNLYRKNAMMSALELNRMVFEPLPVVRVKVADVAPQKHMLVSAAHLELATAGKLDEAGPIHIFELQGDYTKLGKYVVSDGHKRLEAAKRARVKDILAVVLRKPSDYQQYSPWVSMTEVDFDKKRVALSKDALELHKYLKS